LRPFGNHTKTQVSSQITLQFLPKSLFQEILQVFFGVLSFEALSFEVEFLGFGVEVLKLEVEGLSFEVEVLSFEVEVLIVKVSSLSPILWLHGSVFV
jgi:hypothetical protein